MTATLLRIVAAALLASAILVGTIIADGGEVVAAVSFAAASVVSALLLFALASLVADVRRIASASTGEAPRQDALPDGSGAQRECPACGAFNPAGARFCYACGGAMG